MGRVGFNVMGKDTGVWVGVGFKDGGLFERNGRS